MGMLLISALLLPGTLAVWRAPVHHDPMPWPTRLRRGMFLALKIALVQPMMLCVIFPSDRDRTVGKISQASDSTRYSSLSCAG